MIHNAGARHGGLRTTAIRVALIAVALLALTTGCNDDPFNGGLIVRPKFDSSAQQSATASSPTPLITSPAGTPVVTLIVGPIVITHAKSINNPGGGIVAYETADIDSITDADRENLERDAEQSVVFLEIVQLPLPGDTVVFEIPPENAGPWQLIGIGLRNRRETLADILDNDPIWYGFTPEFLNDNVQRGETVFNLLLQPGCALDNPPINTGICTP